MQDLPEEIPKRIVKDQGIWSLICKEMEVGIVCNDDYDWNYDGIEIEIEIEIEIVLRWDEMKRDSNPVEYKINH